MSARSFLRSSASVLLIFGIFALSLWAVSVGAQGEGASVPFAADETIVHALGPALDFGDAPDPTYPTLLASSGDAHQLDGTTWLGAQVDAELEELNRQTLKGGRAALRTASEKTEFERLRSRLVMAQGRYQQPMIVEQIEYLYGMLGRADQKPGKDAVLRLDALRSALDDCRKDLIRIREQP